MLCCGYAKKEETSEEILQCEKLRENSEKIPLSWFFEDREIVDKKLKI